MNSTHNIKMDLSLAHESGNMQTQFASFQNFEQFSASGYSNTPIYVTNPPGIGAISSVAPHSSVLGPQHKIQTTSPDISIPGTEKHSLAPTVRYVQAGEFEDTPQYGISGIPCGIDSEYTDESVVPYCYTSEANYTGIQSTTSNIKHISGRTYNDNLNGSEAAADSQCRTFESSTEYKLPQFTMSSLNTVPQRMGDKDDYIAGSDNDICSTMRWRDPNLSEVISFLSNPSSAIKANAAAYLQHLCYMDDPNKQRTRSLGGIPPLVRLLSYDSPEIHKNACGALRNLSYGRQNDENKRGIKNAGGIDALVHLLCRSQETEVKELVTGVLWNMSSCEDLKRSIIDESLVSVVCSVIKPHSGWDAVCCGETCFSTVFRNASGVLRNVSSAGEHARGCLRNCEHLVECLLYVVRTAIEKNNIGNKTVENCVCILRNLSYRCQEVEDPNYDKHPFITPERLVSSPSKGENLGCFGASKKKKDGSSNSEALHEYHISTEYSKSSATHNQVNKGYELLWQPEVVQYYLSLLQSCSNPETLEAAAGAIQNLSACYWQPSIDIRATVRKEKGLPILVELLRMEVDRVVCAVATALRNLAIDQRNKELIGKYAMRDLVQKLPSGNIQHDQNTSDDTITAVLATINEVLKKNPEFSRSLLDSGGVDRLMNITRRKEKYTSCVLKFASQVLYSMWQHNELRDAYKKNGWKEQDFISKLFAAHNTPPSSPNNANNTLNRPMASQGRTRYEDRTIQRPTSSSFGAKDSNSVMSSNESALLSEMVRKQL
ncbi:catenin delta-2 isoform X2 [Drosophila subpulchrella]|nr:catenin delta-2 isoform X2 [Drosophila subpulchrella]XP_037731774.1 catenin delta-2 isoform X2 [Drosophila subpulchrella]